jgi:hypothetical protein
MTEYVLDVDKWRCGGSERDYEEQEESILKNCSLGSGPIKMLNARGYSCCLGQFALQKGIDPRLLLNKGTPRVVADISENLYDKNFVIVEYYADLFETHNTPLASYLMTVNDDPDTTIQQKILMIRTKLAEHGHTLKVINGDQYLNE